MMIRVGPPYLRRFICLRQMAFPQFPLQAHRESAGAQTSHTVAAPALDASSVAAESCSRAVGVEGPPRCLPLRVALGFDSPLAGTKATEEAEEASRALSLALLALRGRALAGLAWPLRRPSARESSLDILRPRAAAGQPS